jgi:anti-anti-sigma factor
MPRFTIEQRRVQEGIHAVVVAGDVDLHAAPALKRALLELAERNGAVFVVVDLLAATLFDSTTIGVLLAVQKRLRDDGGRLSVVCASVLRAFLVETELDELLDIQPVGADAVAVLAGARCAAA